MAELKFTLQTNLPRMTNWTKRLQRQLPFMIRKAMADSGQDAKKAVSDAIPQYIDRPVSWTRRSVIATKPHTSRLEVKIGFKDDYLTGNKGTPAAKYLQPMAAPMGKVGGQEARKPKGTEKQLRRSGVIGSNQFLVPTGATPLRFNKHGNISGAMYATMISRLKGYNVAGFTANASNAPRSKRKRSSLDFFAGTPGGRPYAIYGRVGSKPRGKGGVGSAKGGREASAFLKRGFKTVFHVIDRPPTYTQSFPVADIAGGMFERTFRSNFYRALDKEVRHQRARGYL